MIAEPKAVQEERDASQLMVEYSNEIGWWFQWTKIEYEYTVVKTAKGRTSSHGSQSANCLETVSTPSKAYVLL